ncbi:MAG TPA: DUF4198 domain-containing protein [Candidatus Limnocylindria bacterium]|nr:DUF4198 domain-containing protein [Candidatus Limnocylindria bacterium]
MVGRASLIMGLGAALSIPVAVSAHEYWLAPSTYRAAAGDTVRIAAYVGTGFRGEPKPYAATRALRFTVQGPKRLDLTRAATNGDLSWTRFVAADGGGALFGYESDLASIELDGPAFDSYLKLEGLNGPRAARARRRERGSARERYARCPKAWVAGTEATRARQVLGLTMEIVPLATPGLGPTLPVRVLYRGRPLRGVLLRAWNRPLASGFAPTDAAARDSVGPATEGRSDRNGLVTLRVDAAGEWLVSAVHMVRAADRRAADWESHWASLTFARARPGR